MNKQKPLKGTQTALNIATAFAGESQARNMYLFYADQAREVGNTKIASLFDEMSRNEREHSKLWFSLLHDGIGDIETNLRQSAEKENEEWNTLYPGFARQAEEDGFPAIARLFDRVAAIESSHEKRFQEALVMFLGNNSAQEEAVEQEHYLVTDSAQTEGFRCMLCGNISAKQEECCPICGAIGYYAAM